MILKTLGKGEAYLKAGFLGFQKSGKTYTATLLAIGVRKHFGLTGPIAMFDTEAGSEYVAPLVQQQTGTDLLGVKARAFNDLVEMAQECLKQKVSVLIVDSVTHPWRELCDAYLTQLNAKRKEVNKPPLGKLEFQHWAAVKGLWARWSNLYLNMPMHCIICGRAGFEYAIEADEDTGRKEVVKTGIKMKVEGEFGFEPSLLVEMERYQEPDGKGGFKFHRQATVLGDRFGVIDGKVALDPTFTFFKPHVEMLKPGQHEPVETALKTETGADETGDLAWHRERREREILCEEIEGEIVANIPGQTAAEKKRKTDLIHEVFGTRSWKAVENTKSEVLRDGLKKIRAMFSQEQPTLPVEPSETDKALIRIQEYLESGTVTQQKLTDHLAKHFEGSKLEALSLLSLQSIVQWLGTQQKPDLTLQ